MRVPKVLLFDAQGLEVQLAGLVILVQLGINQAQVVDRHGYFIVVLAIEVLFDYQGYYYIIFRWERFFVLKESNERTQSNLSGTFPLLS